MCIYCLAAYAEQISFELKLQFTISFKFHIMLEAIPFKFWFTLWSSTVQMRKAVPFVPSHPHPMAEMLRPGDCLVWQKWVSMGKSSEIKLLDRDALKQKMKTLPIQLRTFVSKTFLQCPGHTSIAVPNQHSITCCMYPWVLPAGHSTDFPPDPILRDSCHLQGTSFGSWW